MGPHHYSRVIGPHRPTGAGTAKERNFIGHIIKIHKHEKESKKEWRWAYMLLQLQSNSRVLVELRFVKRSYHLRLGDKVSVVVKNAMPVHHMPNLNVGDEMLEMLSAGTIGCICCPEVYEHARFDFLTELNPEIPIIVSREYERLMEDGGEKRQMTFKMLCDEVALRKPERWYAFVSAIILRVDLVKASEDNKVFCARCECGNVATARGKDGTGVRTEVCRACKSEVDLRLNPQILAGLADETGGFCNREKTEEEHAILLSDQAWRKLMGVGPDIYPNLMNGAAAFFNLFQPKMEAVEEKLLYARKTFVFCWTGTWGGGRFVIVDVL